MAERSSPQGLLASGRRLLATALELAQLRLELLALEFEQEKLRLFDVVGLAVLALLGLGIGTLLLCAWLVWVVSPDQRLAVLGLLGLLFLAGGGWAYAKARSRLQRDDGLFTQSAAELARDREGLGAAADRPASPP